MHYILDGISTIEGLRIGRVYVIEAADGLTLIDTSVPGSLPQIEKELQRVGHHLSDVKRILITHAHSDHFGSLVVNALRSELVLPSNMSICLQM